MTSEMKTLRVAFFIGVAALLVFAVCTIAGHVDNIGKTVVIGSDTLTIVNWNGGSHGAGHEYIMSNGLKYDDTFIDNLLESQK